MLCFNGGNGEIHLLLQVWLKFIGHFKNEGKKRQFRLRMINAIKEIVVLVCLSRSPPLSHTISLRLNYTEKFS